MGNEVENTIKYLDGLSANYGFSQEFGLADMAGMAPHHAEKIKAVLQEHAASKGMPSRQGSATSYSVNKSINAKTAGKSTFMVTVRVSRVGAGAGNVSNPVFFFGGESFNNSATPYLQVQNAGQTVTTAVSGGKNVIRITYGGGGNSTTYELSLGTSGEYPFILNSLVGTNKMMVNGIQTEISDVLQQSQLSSEISTFYFNEFGKAQTDDLTTPKDLYQQQSNGIFMPHEFEISGKRGMLNNVLDIDGFVVKYYFYATPFRA